jgi:FkbH-like protein
MPRPNPPGDPPRPSLAASLTRHRDALARRLAENSLDPAWGKFSGLLQATYGGDLPALAEAEFAAAVDFLGRYFRTADRTYLTLYVGEKLKQFYDTGLDPEVGRSLRPRIIAADRATFLDVLGPDLADDADRRGLEVALDEAGGLLMAEPERSLRLLFVGDCLYLDVMGFLTPLALEDGIGLDLSFAVPKNPAELRNDLRERAAAGGPGPDLIFYSPYTYEFDPAVAAMHAWRRAMRTGPDALAEVADAAAEQVDRTLDVLGTLWECPIYVHNTLNLRRHDGTAAERLKNRLTRPARHRLRDRLNRRLALALEARTHDGGMDHLHLFDETALLDGATEDRLARKFLSRAFQHPAELSRRAALAYRDILAAHVHLRTRKVVVCDLDDTLWRGTIGEGGPVVHDQALQTLLKRLRQRGVVLAINSKNDPQNVRWDGGVLGPDDFVAQQINWDSKVTNLRRIQADLNLKLKDFVFLDDRADQRAQVAEMLPEVWTMDPADPRTLPLLERWADGLPDRPEVDRTEQYRQRTRREQFIATRDEDQAELFARLQIVATIRPARAGDLKRVSELINRTNQFNLAGSRVTPRELRAWHDDPSRRVVVVEAADRFGPMGLIAAVLLDLSGPSLEIAAFVLSCRVFGYGIETAVFNGLARLAGASDAAGVRPIRGMYRETPHNGPCRSFYPDHGFTRDGAAWVLERPQAGADPSWLTVEDQLGGHRVPVGSEGHR